jgi:hypothetical protein
MLHAWLHYCDLLEEAAISHFEGNTVGCSCCIYQPKHEIGPVEAVSIG